MKTTFQDYPLSEGLLKAIELLNYKSPTLVQEQVIPAFLARKDIIVKSQTGSGKTAAFGIPMCQLIQWDENKPQALVITPTRELALQVREDLFHLGRYERLKVVALFGKSPFKKQEKDLKQRTHVAVGTPGRLIDHIERGTLDLSKIEYLVIDEADEMLQMGFIDQVETIIKALPKKRVNVVLSATMPEDIKRICTKYMNAPIEVAIEESAPAKARIVQERYNIRPSEKLELLRDMLTVENPDSCMIFCNTQVAVDEITEELAMKHQTCEKIHGGMEQDDRIKVMDDFRKGKFRYLVATDVAARGIDIDHISLVINYDVPNSKENYVHRIGRTGRIGNTGRALTFVTSYDNKLLADIHHYIGNEIPLRERPTPATVQSAEAAFDSKISKTPELKASKGDKLNEGILKLHINAGKKTKMRTLDIVGTLCGIEGITADDIGIITIVDLSTFVEILNGKGQMVLAALQEKTIKGRLRKVTIADR